MKLELKIGQKVWIEPSEWNRPDKRAIRTSTVSRIGRKYFEVDSEVNSKFNIETGIEQTPTNYKSTVYVNKQDLLDKQEFKRLSLNIKNYFSKHATLEYSLDTLRKIKALIDNNDKTL